MSKKKKSKIVIEPQETPDAASAEVETDPEQTETAELTKQDGLMKLRITLSNEQERIETERGQQKIAEENAAKQKELDERQAAMDADEAERKAINDKADAERREKEDKENRERQEELDKQAERQAAAQKVIDDENDRLQREATIEEAAARALEQAPDRQKLLSFAIDVEVSRVLLPGLPILR